MRIIVIISLILMCSNTVQAARFHNTGGSTHVPFTAEEEAEWDAREAKWQSEQTNKAIEASARVSRVRSMMIKMGLDPNNADDRKAMEEFRKHGL